jgi:4-carboxymuconolactone decarboxylase
MYPSDIDPQSGCRLPPPKREDLDEASQKVFDIINDPKGVTLRGLRGPGGVHLHSPRVASMLRPLNNYLRNESGLTPRVREVAILATARACDNQFEWAAHEVQARKDGVPDACIDAIKHRTSTDGLDETDALIIDLCRESYVVRAVSSATYARALARFGARQLVDLTVLMGYYAMTAGILTAFDMQLDPGQEPLLPMP